MGGGDHEHRAVFIINLVEEPPGADAIPPGLGGVVLQRADVRAKVRMAGELRIDNCSELADEIRVAGACDPFQVAGELAVSKMRSSSNDGPFACARLARPSPQPMDEGLVVENLGHLGVIDELVFPDPRQGRRLDDESTV